MAARQILQSIFLLAAVFFLSILPSTEQARTLPQAVDGQPPAESAPLPQQPALAAAPDQADDPGENSLPEPAPEAKGETALAEKEPAALEADSRPAAAKKGASETAKKDVPPAAKAPALKTDSSPAPAPAPKALAYRWGSPHQITFRTEVRLTNSGSETAEHLWVDLPLLENRSPYQTNSAPKTNYAIDSSKGRMASFYLDTLAPGETKKVTVDYRVTLRPVSLVSTNEVVEKARQAYQQHAGSGNCRTLADRFVGRCRELGVTARVVNGFTRVQRATLAAGALKGCRHSWAEFYLDELGWVPVDLTFGYFADFPYASHLVECYDDQAVHINFLGGKVEAVWDNLILP